MAKNRKTILLSFGIGSVSKIHLYKELGEIPYWISKLYPNNAIIDDYVDSDNLSNFRGVYLHRYTNCSGLIKELRKILYVFQTAKDIDILYLIHISPQSFIRALAYRWGGGKGKIYLKMDAEASPTGKLMRWENILLIKIFYLLLKPLPDIFTIETKRAYSQMYTSCYKNILGIKLFQMPNGFDEESLSEIGITRIPVSQKEKIILTVGRIGTHQKNTELLLDILKSTNLRDWKVYIVGPIESKFNDIIDMFYSQNPHLKVSVIFTGMISQEEKYSLYNRARIFILTSRHEGFAFSFVEAAYMKNYIISTNVGGAADTINVTGGKIITSSKKDDFVSHLNNLFLLSDEKLNELVIDDDRSAITWEWILQNNDGIKKLIDNKKPEKSHITQVFYNIITPISLLFLAIVTSLIYIGYNKLHLYSLLLSLTTTIKKEKNSENF
ncbi:MAG: glycosyltransferase family 4 protein [Bacteroidales bacterium]|nr:glycosyltransferase family 4 protein [Bacteroidales bacterium]